MNRRDFLRRSSLVAAGSAAASASLMTGDYAEAHALMDEAHKQMNADLGTGIGDKTAVTVQIEGGMRYGEDWAHPPSTEPELPDGFVSSHVDATTGCDCYDLEILDDEGTVLKVSDAAFNAGALALWRPVVGKLRCEVTYTVSLSCLPRVTVTIYGSIER